MLTSRISALTTALFVIIAIFSCTPTATAQGVPENDLFDIGSVETTPPAGIEPLPVDSPGSFVLAHFGETHDIWHLVTGYGMDELGEASLIGFYSAQFGQAPHFALLLGILFLNTAFFRPADFRRRMDALTVGWEAGNSADSLFGRDWASLWDTPVFEVRENLGLKGEPVVVGEGIQAAA